MKQRRDKSVRDLKTKYLYMTNMHWHMCITWCFHKRDSELHFPHFQNKTYKVLIFILPASSCSGAIFNFQWPIKIAALQTIALVFSIDTDLELLTALVAFQQNDESDDVMMCVYTLKPQSTQRNSWASNLMTSPPQLASGSLSHWQHMLSRAQHIIWHNVEGREHGCRMTHPCTHQYALCYQLQMWQKLLNGHSKTQVVEGGREQYRFYEPWIHSNQMGKKVV